MPCQCQHRHDDIIHTADTPAIPFNPICSGTCLCPRTLQPRSRHCPLIRPPTFQTIITMKRQRVGIACDKCRELKAKVCYPLLLFPYEILTNLVNWHSVMDDSRCVLDARAIVLTVPGPQRGVEHPGPVQQLWPTRSPTADCAGPLHHPCKIICQHTQERSNRTKH